MHTSRREFLAISATGLLATACTGGGTQASGEGAGAGSGDPKSLKWLIEEPEDAAALKALKQHLETFTESSGVAVKVSTLPFDTMRTVLQTQLRSGEGPDVFNWGSGPSFGGALAKAGLVKDLTSAYAERGWEVYDFAKQRVTVDGKVYGIPGEMETLGLFYNKAALAKAGAQLPTDLPSLRAAAEKVKAAGQVALSVGDQEGWEGGHLLSMALGSDVGSDRVEALIAGQASWDSPEVVAALRLWQDFNAAGFLPKSPTSVDYDTSTASFYSGEAAMIPTGSWLVGEIDDNTDFEVGYIPFPAPDGPGIFSAGLGSGPFVSASTKKTDAALQFLDFLASPEHGQWTVENLHTIPARPIDTTGLEVSPLFAQVLKDVAALATGGDFGQNIDVLTSDAFNEAMTDGVQAVLTGQSTPEKVAASLQAASEK